jgi:hypothetical protein
VTGSWLADDCGSGGRLVFWVAVTLALTDDSGSDRLDAQYLDAQLLCLSLWYLSSLDLLDLSLRISVFRPQSLAPSLAPSDQGFLSVKADCRVLCLVVW